MKTIEIKTLEELLKLDLSNCEIIEDFSVDIKLRLTDVEFEFPIKIFHKVPGFSSKVSVKLALFGRCLVKMPVEIHVKKGAVDSATDFKALVLLMSPNARASVTPGLFIEERNILSASHGVVIKNIKEKDLAYLRARGISKVDAREMVVPF
jgi:Fe-S cluster assembly scaffold protein SufB